VKQIPTPQLIRIPDPALAPIASLAPKAIDPLASGAIDPPNHTQETLREEFLRLQLKPRTRQEYGKSIDYFCRFGVANAARTMSPNQPPATFLSEFLKLSERQAILMVLE
jgi:hypothetical protein